MGFATGFTGGVTLTLSLAYLSVLAHQRNRERQSAILRVNTLLVSELTDPLPPALPPTRQELAAAQRANLIDSAKDRWNAEVLQAVRWAQTQDWDEVREGLETAVGRLWARAFGTEVGEAVGKAERKTSSAVRELQSEARAKAEQARAAASQKAEGVAAVAKSAYADAKAKAGETVDMGEQKAEEVKGGLMSSIKGAFGMGKSKVEEVKKSAKGKVGEELSPVDKALQQRYEKPSGNVGKSVEEVLTERYTPADKKDNAALKGL